MARTLLSALFTVFVLAPGLCEEADARQKYAGIVIDANTDKVIYAHNADARRYPASLTKMMTLYVLFEELEAGRLSKSSRLGVSAHAAGQAPSKLGLKPGQSITVEDAIKALVTKSANDAAVVVAEAIGKTESGFARRMTATARRIGMKRTTFRNASGLPDGGQVTTARDMATLGLRLQRDFPDYYRYFGIRSFTYNGRSYRNHNRLLGHFKGTDGIKTGYTRASGYNLTASVHRDRRHLVGVVMGGRTARSRDLQMRKILAEALPKASANRQVPATQTAEIPVPVPNPATLGTLNSADLSVPETIPVKPTVIAASEAPPAEATSVTGAKSAPESIEEVIGVTPVAEGDTGAGDGTWSIQIGAYSSREDARRRLVEAKKSGVGTLNGKAPLMLAYNKENRVIYRARFSGFDRTTAHRACEELNRKSINCYTLAP